MRKGFSVIAYISINIYFAFTLECRRMNITYDISLDSSMSETLNSILVLVSSLMSSSMSISMSETLNSILILVSSLMSSSMSISMSETLNSILILVSS